MILETVMLGKKVAILINWNIFHCSQSKASKNQIKNWFNNGFVDCPFISIAINWHTGNKKIWIRLKASKMLKIYEEPIHPLAYYKPISFLQETFKDKFNLMDFLNKPELLVSLRSFSNRTKSCTFGYSFKGIFTQISRLSLRKASRPGARIIAETKSRYPANLEN